MKSRRKDINDILKAMEKYDSQDSSDRPQAAFTSVFDLEEHTATLEETYPQAIQAALPRLRGGGRLKSAKTQTRTGRAQAQRPRSTQVEMLQDDHARVPEGYILDRETGELAPDPRYNQRKPPKPRETATTYKKAGPKRTGEESEEDEDDTPHLPPASRHARFQEEKSDARDDNSPHMDNNYQRGEGGENQRRGTNRNAGREGSRQQPDGGDDGGGDDNSSRDSSTEASSDEEINNNEDQWDIGAGHDPQDGTALDPTDALGTGPLNFATKAAKKHYDSATRPFYDEEERPDLEPVGISGMLQKLQDHDDVHRFSSLWIPKRLGQQPNERRYYMPTEHGKIRWNHLLRVVRSYIHTNTRRAQDDKMLAECLLKSVSKTAHTTISSFRKQYQFAHRVKSGVVVLFIILRESRTRTVTEPDTVKLQLAGAVNAFKQFEGNVRRFNEWILQKQHLLHIHGETSTDLRMHLMRAYASSSDYRLTQYVDAVKNEYRDKKKMKKLTPERLMSLVQAKYDDIQHDKELDAQEKRNQGGDPDLVAMESTQNWKNKYDKLRKKVNKGKNPDKTPTDTKSNSSKHKKSKKGKQVQFPAEEAKSWPAPADPSVPKNYNGLMLWYCTHHKKWGMHKSDECRMHKSNKKKTKSSTFSMAAIPKGPDNTYKIQAVVAYMKQQGYDITE